MRRVTAVLSAAAFVIATVGVLAQAKTNFAGTWTRDAAAAPAGAPAGGAGGGGGRGGGGGGRGGWGMECTITQDATTLTVKYAAGQGGDVTMAYKLDGSDSKNSVMGRGGAATDVVSKASWDGANLKIVTPGAAGAGDTTMVVSIAAGKLSIATTAPPRGGGDAVTTTATYSKKM